MLMTLVSDYIIQGQVITLVMGLVDDEGGWDGPKYVAEHLYTIEFMEGSQLINEFTSWNGPRAYELMSLALPKPGESESEDQKEARVIVRIAIERKVLTYYERRSMLHQSFPSRDRFSQSWRCSWVHETVADLASLPFR